LGAGCFHEHAAELLEVFWVVNHFDCGLNGGSEGAPSVWLPLAGVLGVFMPLCATGSFAEGFGFKMAEIQVDGEPEGHIIGLDVPDGGENSHAIVEVSARYHIGTKVRSF
jgi:hypothetical protein